MTLRPGITACVAAHPARFQRRLIHRALTSIADQTLQPDAIVMVNDKGRRGAGWTRQTILDQVDTEWMAWLDSDDAWFPRHLEKLYQCAIETDSVYVFSYFQPTVGDPFATPSEPLGHFGREFNVCNPHHTTITALMKTEMAKQFGYGASDFNHPVSNEDWGFIVRFSEYCCQNGLKMTHLPERTWLWEQNTGNTSGLPHKGDAAQWSIIP